MFAEIAEVDAKSYGLLIAVLQQPAGDGVHELGFGIIASACSCLLRKPTADLAFALFQNRRDLFASATQMGYTRSGHQEVMGIRAPCLCDVVRCLECFAEDRSTAQAAYLDRLRAVGEERRFRAGIRELPWWKAVADDEQTVNPRNAPDDAFDFEGRPLLAGERQRPPLPQVQEIFEQEIGISAGCLAGNGRTRILSWHRCLFATLAVSWLGHRSKDVGAILGKGPGSVSRWVAEGLELQLSEPRFRLHLETLAKALGQEWSDVPGHGTGDA